MRHGSVVVALTLAAALAGCATPPPYNPFKVSEEQFRATVKRIALVPVGVPPHLRISGSAISALDSLIETRLQQAGFITYPAQNWAEALLRSQKDLGGMFDSATGRLDSAKAKTAWVRTGDEVRAKFPFDAVLAPRIEVVPAGWASGMARWDGVSEPLASGIGVLLAPNASGTLPALSLVVSVGTADPDGPIQYRHRGGIQVLEKLTPVSERFGGKLFASVPREELLANAERNAGAVEAALGPLLKTKP